MIPTTSDWLNSIKVEAAGNENSGNHNTKSQDMSLDALIALLNEGYDRVTWVGSDRDKAENEICQKYDANKTTWSLEAFINVSASLDSGIKVVATMSKEDYSEEDWNKIISSPGKSLKYAEQNNFENLPLDIIDSIASDSIVSYRFVNRFLKRNTTDDIPEQIVRATLGDANEVMYLADIYGDQPNCPVEYKKMTGITTKKVDGVETEVGEGHFLNNQRGTQYERSNTNIPFDAPIYAHSHVGCQCMLMVWKSNSPEDVVFIDANGW